jgi:hypothetical protein
MILDEQTLKELQSLGIKGFRYSTEAVKHPVEPQLIAKVLENEKKRQFKPNYDPKHRWATARKTL